MCSFTQVPLYNIVIIKNILIRSFHVLCILTRPHIISNGIRRLFVFQRVSRRTLATISLRMQNPQLNDFVRPPPPFRHPLVRLLTVGYTYKFYHETCIYIISVALSAHRPFCNNTYSDNPQTAHPLARHRGRTRRRIPCRVDV